jgi:3,4-dihydroxy 2-butanone 4-phosphate synthase/GTP cyclohydrolase II
VRVHVQATLGDVVGVQSSKLGWPLRSAMRRIAREGRGVVVILRQEETPRELMQEIRSLQQPEDELLARRDAVTELRTFGTGAQILRALGVRRMRVLSAPKQMHALSGFGLEVVEYVSDTDEETPHG